MRSWERETRLTRLVCFGNSLVAGTYGGNFVAQLMVLRVDDLVINAGQTGNTIFNLLHRLETDVLTQQPDSGVLILAGGNDAISWSQPETRPYYARAMQVPDGVVTPQQYQAAFRELLERIQAAQIRSWVILPPLEYNLETAQAMWDYNAIMAEICSDIGVPTFDLYTALMPQTIPERPPLDMQDIRRIGQRIDSGWNDYETAWREGGFTYSFDGIHFRKSTAMRVATLLSDFLDAT
jgi:lysophospholipase L1-like esterase